VSGLSTGPPHAGSRADGPAGHPANFLRAFLNRADPADQAQRFRAAADFPLKAKKANRCTALTLL